MQIKFFVIAVLFMSTVILTAQDRISPVAQSIIENAAVFDELELTPLLSLSEQNTALKQAHSISLNDGVFYKVDATLLWDVRRKNPENLKLDFTLPSGEKITLDLTKAKVFSEEFKVYTSLDPDNPYPYEKPVFYWGIVSGDHRSLAAVTVTRGELSGLISYKNQDYTIGKIENDPQSMHVLYKNEDLRAEYEFHCATDPDLHYFGEGDMEINTRSSNNKCIKMFLEVDYDITVAKGGVQQATDYVTGAFNQVLILYANDEIEMVINEMFVWAGTDPFTGPSTSDYLVQFRNYKNGNYNGDLAHLVGRYGGGGVAYLNVLCNSYWGVGYSAINMTYNNVPTYSWTVMVLAHEVGHNLGSWHTHDCRWNGNNTPIDCCGTNAGYPGGNCPSGYSCTIPDPVGGGTIMSYCHLRPVGINLANGFGPLPKARMQERINASACVTACNIQDIHDAGITLVNAPTGIYCEGNAIPSVVLRNFGNVNLTSVTIQYRVDANSWINHNWTGNLAPSTNATVTLPNVTFGTGIHTFSARTANPNGQADNDPANDQSISNFEYFPENCNCNEAVINFPINPLTHSGAGSSSTAVSLSTGSKNVSFTVSGMDARTGGNPGNRYDERVVITYLDGNNVNQNYGTFLGSQQSSVNVNIAGFVNSVTVTLSNAINNNWNGTLSVNLSSVNYCSGEPPCPDQDGDGVCDVDDICPGFNDNLIGTPCDDGDACTSNDVYTTDCICAGTLIPGCGEECQNPGSSNFSVNPLTHLGTGSSSSSATLPAGAYDVAFTVSNMSSRLSGNPGQRYNDQVTISYVNGSGNTVSYGVFLGSNQSSVNVNIPGTVQSVSVSLADGHDGDASPTVLTVNISSATYCLTAPLPFGESDDLNLENSVKVYPNPATSELFIGFDGVVVESAEVTLTNILGMEVGRYTYDNQGDMRISLTDIRSQGNMLFVKITVPGQAPVVRSVLVFN